MEEFEDLPEDLSFAFTAQKIHKQILKEWRKLKESITTPSNKNKIEEFDKLLNYFFND